VVSGWTADIHLAEALVSMRMKFDWKQDKNVISGITEFCGFLEFARSGNGGDF
jgi:hypothetical protein